MVDFLLLQIAKTVILSEFDKSYTIDRDVLVQKYPYLQKKGAAFVTLNKGQELRGCIGSIVAHQPLIDDIIHNAKAAAFSDPRFHPLQLDEIDETFTLEVSVLSEPRKIEYKDFDDLAKKIVPNKDGLILQYGQYQGTFLPQVWQQLQTPKLFLEHLSYKAGANPSIYEYHPDIYRYYDEHIKEVFDAIPPLQ
ncbi:COG2078: Uncharacterized ACR [hydrothermal vent metagenome]|uniref:COG2078: Uncharacterized ACR n=1 Tax=hydrothermal vent metagenome TaxID=652676 RepID=A0A1W1BJW2_9ZZZZ